MRIVSVHAHPDDAEILAGGTLALLARLGHQITIVTLSNGDCGSTLHEADEIASIRKTEATESAALIGADYRWGGFRDMAIFSDDASRRAVTGLLRELRPDVVLTAAPSDYLSDHEATSQLVRDACFAAPIPNYTALTQRPPLQPYRICTSWILSISRTGVDIDLSRISRWMSRQRLKSNEPCSPSTKAKGCGCNGSTD
jgi:N-acetylglucosamine malate deacetylase 1